MFKINFFSTRVRHNFLLFVFWLSLIFAFLVKIYSLYPFLIEYFFSREIFLKISLFQRDLFGKYSFNFGDFFFIILILIFIYFIIKLILLIWYKKYKTILNLSNFYLLFSVFFVNYILFSILWGMNFKRESIAKSLKIDTIIQYNQKHLEYISEILINEINESEKIAYLERDKLNSFNEMKKNVCLEINDTKLNLFYSISPDSLIYSKPSIKKSMLGFLMNRMGIAGYHNPFTGEAIINNNIPSFLKPAAISHEIMHQLGYAREFEAAFVSYLFAKNNKLGIVSYSIFLDAFLIINQELEKNYQINQDEVINKLNHNTQKQIQIFNKYINKNSYANSIISDNSYNFFINLNSKSKITDKNSFIILLLAYFSINDKKNYDNYFKNL